MLSVGMGMGLGIEVIGYIELGDEGVEMLVMDMIGFESGW